MTPTNLHPPFPAARRISAVGRLALVLVSALAVGAGYFVLFGSPMAFLRGTTLRLNVQDADAPLPASPDAGTAALDAVVAIPAPPMEIPWWSPAALVDPDALVQYTLREGAGNCAAKSRGLGWWLGERSIPFRLVYVMDDPDVRSGDAHTMVETSWVTGGKLVTAILDPLAAGVPMVDGEPLSLRRLIEGRDGLDVRYVPDRPDIEEVRLRPYGVFRAGEQRWKAFVAVSRGEQVLRHLRLMKSLSTVLPDSFAARVVGIMLSIELGIYPTVDVTPGQSARVSALLRADMWIARTMVWCIRLLVLLGAFWVVGRCIRAIRRKPAASGAPLAARYG